MATVNFKLRPTVKKDGTQPVIIYILYKGKRLRYSAGVSATPSQWNTAEQNIIIRKHAGGKQTYLDLLKKKTELQTKITTAELNNISAEAFFNSLKGGGLSLFTFIKTRVTELTVSGKIGNARAYKGLLDQLVKYKEDTPLASVDYNYINSFKLAKYVAGNSANTLRYYLKTFRAVINEAIRRGYFNRNSYPFIKGLVPGPEQTAKRFLTAADVEKIERYKTQWPGEQRAKDLFLLGFYLRGADIVDVSHLTNANIKRDRIEYKRQKSGQILSIKVIPKAAEILERYKGGKYLMPLIDKNINEDRPKYALRVKNLNRSLKNIGEKLELPIRLTTKVNRHSWATIAKQKGVSKDVIKEALGHQDRTVTEVYLGAYDQEILDSANSLVCG